VAYAEAGGLDFPQTRAWGHIYVTRHHSGGGGIVASIKFGETLSTIRQYDFTNQDEVAVKQGVILPLINRVGWDTENIMDVRPELQVQVRESQQPKKVDYALRIGGTNRVFIEAKAWGKTLTKIEEDQLNQYCRSAKVNLGALTNGCEWRLYLHKPGRKWEQKLFLKFDIVDDSPSAVEKHFSAFLAREKVLTGQSVKQTVEAALDLIREKENDDEAFRKLESALKTLGSNSQTLATLLANEAAGIDGTPPTEKQVKVFMELFGIKIIGNSPEPSDKGGPKPTSFTFQTGEEKPVVKEVKDWKEVLVGVCELIAERRPDDFDQILELGKPFSASKGPFFKHIGSTSVYLNHTFGANSVKKACARVLDKFGYPKESLSIQDKDGKDFQA
jgi:predicted type IV restriction endonuclease